MHKNLVEEIIKGLKRKGLLKEALVPPSPDKIYTDNSRNNDSDFANAQEAIETFKNWPLTKIYNYIDKANNYTRMPHDVPFGSGSFEAWLAKNHAYSQLDLENLDNQELFELFYTMVYNKKTPLLVNPNTMYRKYYDILKKEAEAEDLLDIEGYDFSE